MTTIPTHKPNKLTHPADGLYFLSKDLLKRIHACVPHRTLWIRKNGHGEVPVTLERLIRHAEAAEKSLQCIGNGMPWLLSKMDDLGRITRAEYHDVRPNLFIVTPAEAARKVMDALYARAKREKHPGLQR